MKKTYISFLIVVGFILSSASINAQDLIHSTLHGGNWNDTLTWVGFKIPGPSDDVSVEGTVDVTGAECNNLSVSANGILENRSYNNYTLKVFGNITNNGIIRNYPGWYNLYLVIGGDIINNGEWSNSYTYLVGDVEHVLNFTKEFTGYRLEVVNENGGLIDANTDITFKGTKIDMNGGTIKLPAGGKLFMYGEWIFHGKITGTNCEVHLYDNAFLERITLDKVALKGVVNVFSSVILDEDPIIDLE